MKKILGILGKPGAGKDLFCNFFEKNHPEVEIFKFSDPLSEVLRIFFDNIKRDDQQWLANSLRARFGEDILAKGILKKIEFSKANFVLLNGVRVFNDYEAVRSVGGFIVYIKTDPIKRWQRMKSREEKKDDNVSYEQFLKLDEGKSEVDIEKIGQKADFVIENNGTKEELEKKVLEIIKKCQ